MKDKEKEEKKMKKEKTSHTLFSQRYKDFT